MFNAKKSMQFGLAFTMLVLGAAVEFTSPVVFSGQSSVDSVEVASRYHLRNRTPNFFGRSKTTTSPATTTPATTRTTQPTVRRG